jgi:hypothetical protein
MDAEVTTDVKFSKADLMVFKYLDEEDQYMNDKN